MNKKCERTGCSRISPWKYCSEQCEKKVKAHKALVKLHKKLGKPLPK